MPAAVEGAKKTVFWGVVVSESLNGITKQEARRRGMNLSEFVRYAVSRFLDDYAANPDNHIESEYSSESLPCAK